jgi:hypothetical protein
MPQIQMTPAWPSSLQAYEYLRTATKSDWAWEYLRRNFDYQANARLSGLEQGRRNLTIVTLYELASALGVSHIELVRQFRDG